MKLSQLKPNWIGNVLRLEEDSRRVTALAWTPDGKRTVCHPKPTWRKILENNKQELGWNSLNEIKQVAKDRVSRKKGTAA